MIRPFCESAEARMKMLLDKLSLVISMVLGIVLGVVVGVGGGLLTQWISGPQF